MSDSSDDMEQWSGLVPTIGEPMIYTVRSVVRGNEYPTKFGEMVGYKLSVESEEGGIEPVELGQKVTTPAPFEGQKINGHIEDGQYGKKLKKDPMAPGADMRPMNAAPYHAPQSPKSDAMSKDDWELKDRRKSAEIAFLALNRDAVELAKLVMGNIKEASLVVKTVRVLRYSFLMDLEAHRDAQDKPTPPIIHGDSDEIGSDLDF